MVSFWGFKKNQKKPRKFLTSPIFSGTDSSIEGTTVFVCYTSSGGCTPCGEPTTANTGRKWVVFNCNAQVVGDQIKVTQYSRYMAFCEVKVSDDLIFESR